MTRDLRQEVFSGPGGGLFKRHEDFRNFAEKVLGVHIVLTPSSEGTHIRATRHVPDVGVTYNTVSYFVSHLEKHNSVLDVISLTMLQACKDVGGLNVLH